ncbi:hypothetical protein C8F01DRAFT_1370037 [Mycena amicta]|nr:hypothetical protein C8F01DRAFT_1370037 [Mycena amicta]
MLFTLVALVFATGTLVSSTPMSDVAVSARQSGGNHAILGGTLINQVPTECQPVCLAAGQCQSVFNANDCCSTDNSIIAFHCLNCFVFIGDAAADDSQLSYNEYQAGCAASGLPVQNALINGLFVNTGLQASQTQQTTPAAQSTATSAPILAGPGSGTAPSNNNTTAADPSDKPSGAMAQGPVAAPALLLAMGGLALSWVV